MNGLRVLLPGLRRRLLLDSHTLSRFTDCYAGGLLALFVLEVSSWNWKPVSGENVRCFSLARQSKKRSHGERRQSKLNDVFHWYVFFCECALRPHKFKPTYRSKPLRKVNVRLSVPNMRAGDCKLRPFSHSRRTLSRDRQLKFHQDI